MASVLGKNELIPLHWAGLTNGFTAHAEDFDDTHMDTVIHPTSSVFPVSLAFCETRHLTGKDMLLATALGGEVAIRVGLALGLSHFERGWHMTSTAGHFGGVVAGAKLCSFNAEQFENAFGLAGSMAAGTMNALGTMAKAFHPGKAAYNSVLAIVLTEAGFTGSLDGFDGRRSFVQVASENPRTHLLVEGLGDKWNVLANQHKRYPCGVVSHPAILCAEHLSAQFADNIEGITSVEVHANPVVLKVMGKENPVTELEAKFSVYHLVALALSHGGVRVQNIRLSIDDPAILHYGNKVHLNVDPRITKDTAKVMVHHSVKPPSETEISDRGPLFKATAHHLSDTDLEEKFYTLIDGKLKTEHARELVESIWNLEKLASLDSVLRLSTKEIIA